MRRAVLLSIETYLNQKFEVARRDREAMVSALTESGYAHLEALPNPRDARHIEDFLGAFFGKVTAGDVIVVYTTGHAFGATWENKMLLVLGGFATGTATDVDNLKHTLFLTDHVRYLAERGNRGPMLLVGLYDACRATVIPEQARAKATWVASEPKTEGHWPAVPTLVALACAKQGEAYYDPSPTGLSHFTAALRHVIPPTHPARSFDDITDTIAGEVMALSNIHQGLPQLVDTDRKIPAGSHLSQYPIFDGPHDKPPGDVARPASSSPPPESNTSGPPLRDGHAGSQDGGSRGYPYVDIPVRTGAYETNPAFFRFCFPANLIKYHDPKVLWTAAKALAAKLLRERLPRSSSPTSEDERYLTPPDGETLVGLFNAGALAGYGVQYVDPHNFFTATPVRPISVSLTPDVLDRTAGVVEAVLPDRKYSCGLGRRKSAVARVRVCRGSGRIELNGRSLNDYLTSEDHRKSIFGPLVVANVARKVDLFANCTGGGHSGQAGAVVLGLARALVEYDRSLEPALRAAGFMTRDSRMKERKKYGQRGARRRFQFSKR